jgi:dienelactone hydrolase
MIRDVVTRDARAEDWPAIRESMRRRIDESLGTAPQRTPVAEYAVDERYEAFGCVHERFHYHALPGYACSGVIVYPPEPAEEGRHRGALCIHGTDFVLAKHNVLRPDKKPHRAYGIELAKRGFLCVSVDQFGFGDWVLGTTEAGLYEKFSRDFPGWSLDGIRLFVLQGALDILGIHPRVDGERLCCIGNSLGGRSAVYLAAFDERIKAAVVSTGVSPNLSNIYRNLSTAQNHGLSPRLNAATLADGRPPWEYEELLALIAPRALILLEPFNDPGNPFIETTIDCFLKARRAWELLGASPNATLVCHGRGHDTPPEMRSYAYDLLEWALIEK